MYKLDLENGEYITPRQRKNFDYAIEWCLENDWYSCKVNRTNYNFDLDKMEVSIIGIGYKNYHTYKIKKVEEE